MAKARFYEPQPIVGHPAVQHKVLNERTDAYVGKWEDLCSAGVVREHMAPPRASLSWRPAAVSNGPNQTVEAIPGYVKVTRLYDGTYRAAVTVSVEVQVERQEAAEQRHAEFLARRSASNLPRQVEPMRLEGPRQLLGSTKVVDNRRKKHLTLAWSV